MNFYGYFIPVAFSALAGAATGAASTGSPETALGGALFGGLMGALGYKVQSKGKK